MKIKIYALRISDFDPTLVASSLEMNSNGLINYTELGEVDIDVSEYESLNLELVCQASEIESLEEKKAELEKEIEAINGKIYEHDAKMDAMTDE
jgi:peptidoglycan hydrolase CwlO-like protein